MPLVLKLAAKISTVMYEQLHGHFRHRKVNSLVKMVKDGIVTGLKLGEADTLAVPATCVPCIEGKQTCKLIAKEAEEHATEPASRTHTGRGCLFWDPYYDKGQLPLLN